MPFHPAIIATVCLLSAVSETHHWDNEKLPTEAYLKFPASKTHHKLVPHNSFSHHMQSGKLGVVHELPVRQHPSLGAWVLVSATGEILDVLLVEFVLLKCTQNR